MTASDVAAFDEVAHRSRGWIGRAFLVVALSILAHAIVLVIGRRALMVPAIAPERSGLIEAMLLRSPAAPPPETKPEPPPRPPKAPAVRREAPPPAPVAEPVPSPEPAANSSIDPTPPLEEGATAPIEPVPPPAVPERTPPEAELPAGSELDASGSALLAAVDSAQAQRALLPVSARYVYQTTDTRFPAVSGTTTVQWRFEEDQTYTAHLLTTVFGFTVFDLKSSGRVQRFGLVPDRYTERTIGRAEWATGFDWTAHRVTFGERSRQEREAREGMQDRLSFQFQLMVLGQRLPMHFRPGASIVLPVGARTDVTTYRFTVVGAERLRTGAGELDTVKVERPKSADGSDSRIEVWLAPEHAWLPVKLRFTDRRDNVTENVLADIMIPVP